jgi:hypothetical protein
VRLPTLEKEMLGALARIDVCFPVEVQRLSWREKRERQKGRDRVREIEDDKEREKE